MNSGYSGIAAWMLDDAMHSNGDAGNIKDIKLWGMWNILGEKVFHDASQVEIRPWYYTWALMCRYFPTGTNILKVSGDRSHGVFVAAGEYQGNYVVAAVNVQDNDRNIAISLPAPLDNALFYVYEKNRLTDANKQPVPAKSNLNVGKKFKTTLHANSFVLLTNIK